ncbi:endoglucanase [Penicillium longicatenatum]|nr:endoglucanase [Penicillium longicatenatum]
MLNAEAYWGLKWVGVDESGAEWGTVFPGTTGVDYFFPSESAIGTLITEGYNIFRMPFAMERMAVGSLTASPNSAYLTPYMDVINYITLKGAYAVIDAHNYGRYNGQIITDTTGFQTFWSNVATAFKGNSKVLFDINNEYNTMDQTQVFNLNQAVINGIRGAGATSQYIFAEGNSWTGASTWSTVNDNLKSLVDSSNMLVYEMHQYLNSDGSGATSECASSTVGVDRVSGGTAWLKANGKLGVLGEFAGGANSVCQTAVKGLMDRLQTKLRCLAWSDLVECRS